MGMDKNNQSELRLAEGEIAPCGIVIDREGDWYYQGGRMHRPDIVSHLCQNMGRDETSGLYIIQVGKQRCYLEVEDTPLVITGVSHSGQGERSSDVQMLLAIKYLEKAESLDPETLWVGKENVLYCKVMEEQIPARFLRPAYYQIAQFIKEDPEQKGFYLSIGRDRYYIDQGN